MTQFFDMWIATPATAIRVFQAIKSDKSINKIPWENCITLDIDNTIVIIPWL